MFGRTTGWLGAGVWVGLLLIVSSACTAGPGTPAAAKPAVSVQQPATTGQQSSGASQKPSQATASQDTGALARAFDPCTLLTGSEAEAIVGKLRSGPEPVKGQDGSILKCKFVTVEAHLVTLSVVDAVNWDFKQGAYKGDKDNRFEKVAGLGDDAFFVSQPHIGDQLVTLKKPYLLELHVNVDTDKNMELAKAIAEKALPRLR
jgi:hypothetical protein